MILVDNHNKTDLHHTLANSLPVYVPFDGVLFKVKDISKQYFRNSKRIEVSNLKTKEPSFHFPKCDILRIEIGQVVFSSKEEATEYSRLQKIKTIQEEYPEIKRKYLEYTAFIKDNPEMMFI